MTKTEATDVYRETAKSYDKIASYYAARHDSLEEVIDLLIKFADTLPKGGAILDAGCGHGRDADYFSNLGFAVTGVDFSPELLKIAESRAPKADFLVADVRSLPFDDEQFDGVWMNAVLHHLLVKDISIALMECRRVLKRGGKLYVSFHLSSDEGWDYKYGGNKRFFSGATKDSVAEALEVAGMITTCTLTRSSEDRWFHWFAERPADDRKEKR